MKNDSKKGKTPERGFSFLEHIRNGNQPSDSSVTIIRISAPSFMEIARL